MRKISILLVVSSVLMMFMCIGTHKAEADDNSFEIIDSLIIQKTPFQKDYNSIYELWGKNNVFSISNDSTFWVTCPGEGIHFSKGFYLPWNRLTDFDDKEEDIEERFNDACFFNADTGFVLLADYYDPKLDIYENNSLFWTGDGGQNWEKKDYPSAVYLPTIIRHFDKKGNVWICENSENILYSNDYGKTWVQYSVPFSLNKDKQVKDIYCDDKQNGIIGGVNDLFLTNDNCKTWRRIPTPFDQNEMPSSYSESSYCISNAQIFGEYIIVNQENWIFYTKRDLINWTRFDNMSNFICDVQSIKLFLVSSNGYISMLDENLKQIWEVDQKYNHSFANIVTLNGSLYAYDYPRLYKINKTSYEQIYQYGGNIRSDLFSAIDKAGDINWGCDFNWGCDNHWLFRSEDSLNWYHFAVPPGYVHKLKAINDSTALMSNRSGTQTLCTITRDTVFFTEFNERRPLDDFLKHDVTEVIVTKGISHCMGTQLKRKIRYREKGSDTFVCDQVKMSGTIDSTINYSNSFRKDKIDSILRKINMNPIQILTFKDLQISQEDRDSLINSFKHTISKYNTIDTADEMESMMKGFFLTYYPWLENDSLDISQLEQIVNNLETISQDNINNILTKSRSNYFISTESSWLKLQIINERADTIAFDIYFLDDQSWLIKWILDKDGICSQVRNLQLSEFISDISPFYIPKPNAIELIMNQLYKEKLRQEDSSGK